MILYLKEKKFMKGIEKTKPLLVAFCLLFLMTSPLVFAKESAIESEITTVTYYFDKPELIDKGFFTKITLNDCIVRNAVSKPLIPVKTAKILLPQGKQVTDVKVNFGIPLLLDSGVLIEHGQPVNMIGNKAKFVKPDQEVYNSNEPYPSEMFTVDSVVNFRGFDILYVSLHPVRYIPAAGKLLYFSEMTVEVFLENGKANSLFRGEDEDFEKISMMVDNPGIAKRYGYDDVQILETNFLSSGDYDYVIITDSSLTDDFQPLLNYKSAYTTTNMVDTTFIDNNYVGGDLQEKIRDFISDAYLNWGTTYVLLGGDVEIVPCRYLYGYVGTFPPSTADIPSDIYYAGLDGTWNDDGDGDWGEYADNPDYIAEVYVGRAPVNTANEVSDFINKVINFESSVKPKKVQLHQSRLRSGNSPDSRTVSEDCAQWVPNDYTVDKLYEENAKVTKTDWIDAFNWGPLVIQHTGHGWYTSYDLNYENGGGVSWYNSDSLGLSNSFLPIHMSLACLSGAFDDSDCLAEAYMLNANGGAGACLLNSREGWFYTSDASEPSGEFIEREFYQLFQNNIEPLSKMMQFAKEDLLSYVTPNTGDASCWRWCYYDINLLGDPESPALTQRGGNTPPDAPTNPSPADGATDVSTSPTLSVDVSDTDGDTMDVSFYDASDDALIGTDTGVASGGTASVTWSGLSYNTNYGWYAVADDGFVSTQSAIWQFTTITLNPPSITISTPNDGEIIYAGDTYHITWTTTPGNGAILNVDLEYSTDGGTNYNNIVTGTEDDGIHSWTVPDDSSTQCLVRGIVHDDNGLNGEDTSDSTFTIIGIPPAAPSNLLVQHYGSVSIQDTSSSFSTSYSEPTVNDHTATHTSDDFYHIISEANVEGGSGKAAMDITYDIPISSGTASPYTLFIETYMVDSGDSFTVSYTVNGAGGQTNIITIPSSENTLNHQLIGVSAGDTINVNIKDSSWTPQENIGTVYIDHLYIESGSGGGGTEDNKLTWDASYDDGTGADDVSNYNIYKSDINGEPWNYVGEVTADNSATYSYIDSGAGTADSTQWWYVVSAIDADGLPSADSNSAQEPGTQNNPPYTPSNPSPVDTATAVSISADLSWNGGDPDGDPVTYDVYFGINPSPSKVSSNQTTTTYDPGTMTFETTYYWQIISWDDNNQKSVGTVWSFTTENEPQNNPPYIPSNPNPVDDGTGVSINTDLTWTGGDPDSGDVVEYDVYFGSSSPPSYVTTVSSEFYDPGTLSYLSTYYWKIISRDSHGVETAGPEWSFTTEAETSSSSYVWDINWKVTGIHIKSIVTIRYDSDNDNIAESSDALLLNADVYFTLTHNDTGEYQTFIGTTDKSGIVEFQWKQAPTGSFTGLVTDIIHNTYQYDFVLDVDNPDYFTTN